MSDWALLGTQKHGPAWHRVESVHPYGHAGWARYVTVCGLGIGGRDVAMAAAPLEPVCADCEAQPETAHAHPLTDDIRHALGAHGGPDADVMPTHYVHVHPHEPDHGQDPRTVERPLS